MSNTIQNITTEESELKKNIARIIKGTIFSILISLVLLLIYALILTYTNISENTIMPVVTIIVAISILTGSIISVLKIRKNGLINGGIVGLAYVIFLYIASSMCLVGFSLTLNSFILLLTRNSDRNDWRNYRSEFI